jgi:DNA-binding transcriptional ArsR family regulator
MAASSRSLATVATCPWFQADVQQPAISRHLRVLRQHGLIERSSKEQGGR